MNAPGYSFGVLLCTMLGCWVMRHAKLRWPSIGTLGSARRRVRLHLLLRRRDGGVLPDADGPLHVPRSHPVPLPLPRHLLPVPDLRGVHVGWRPGRSLLLSASSRTIAAGPSSSADWNSVQGGFVKQQSIRFLAIFAAVSLFFFVFYNLPAQWFAMHADPWPEDIQKRSYFTMGICGEGTGRLCPHPALPIDRAYELRLHQPGWQAGPSRRDGAPEDRSLRPSGSDIVDQCRPTRCSLCVRKRRSTGR